MKAINQTHHKGTALDSELRYTPDGLAILSLTVATREGGEHERQSYNRVVVFGAFAEALANKLGDAPVVEVLGRLNQRSGEKEVFNSIIAKNLMVLDDIGYSYVEDAKENSVLMDGINRVVVSGNLTDEVAFDFTHENKHAVANFSLVINTGVDSRPIYLRCTAWGETAETIKNFKKGAGVTVTGRLLRDSYEHEEKGTVYYDYIEVKSIGKLLKTQ